MTKQTIKLHKYDRDKTYFYIPELCEAEQLTEDTEYETSSNGQTHIASGGCYVVSIQGNPVSVVERLDFEKYYYKLDELPKPIRFCINRILAWKIGIKLPLWRRLLNALHTV